MQCYLTPLLGHNIGILSLARLCNVQREFCNVHSYMPWVGPVHFLCVELPMFTPKAELEGRNATIGGMLPHQAGLHHARREIFESIGGRFESRSSVIIIFESKNT